MEREALNHGIDVRSAGEGGAPATVAEPKLVEPSVDPARTGDRISFLREVAVDHLNEETLMHKEIVILLLLVIFVLCRSILL